MEKTAKKDIKKINMGAEAVIYKENNTIIKERIKKTYRIKELDEKLRKERTKKEAKIMEKLAQVVNVPKIKEISDFTIKMEYIKGKQLPYKEEIFEKLGEEIAKMHKQGIVHGDLSPKNIIYQKKLFFIDFGLSKFTHRHEDFAVDLLNLRNIIFAEKPSIAKNLWKKLETGYIKEMTKEKGEKIITQLNKALSRGRYKAKNIQKKT